MDENLPIVYISALLIILTLAIFYIGREVIRTRRTENKLGRLQKKLKEEKGTSQEYYELGSLYLDKKLFVQSVKLLQQAIKIAGEEIEPENRALIYNALGYAYFAQEQYDVAIRNYKEALKNYPEYVTALNNLGHVYEKKQLISQALEAYEQALEVEPKNTTAKRRAESLSKRLVGSKN